MKLQSALKLQNWQKSNLHQVEGDLQIHNPDEIQKSLTYHNIYFYMKLKILINVKFSYNAITKGIFLKKSAKRDMSSFSEFHQDYKHASNFLFYIDWIFTNFLA